MAAGAAEQETGLLLKQHPSQGTNEWDTSQPSESFLILTQCLQLPEKVFMEHWLMEWRHKETFQTSSLCVAVSHQKPLQQWEEFFFSRSIKTEGCWRSLAGIRVEPSWFLYIFPFLLLLSPPAHFSKSQQGLEGRSRTRLHVESKGHTLDLSRELTTACGSSAPSN